MSNSVRLLFSSEMAGATISSRRLENNEQKNNSITIVDNRYCKRCQKAVICILDSGVEVDTQKGVKKSSAASPVGFVRVDKAVVLGGREVY